MSDPACQEKWIATLAATVLAALSSAVAADVPPSAAPEALDERRIFFEKRIRPVLVEHCYECHSAEADKRKGGLHLDNRASLLAGGDSGPALVPGEPNESLLIRSVRYHDPDLEMPPEERLSDRVISDLEQWIRDGAYDPRTGEVQDGEDGIDLEEGRKFWSFQPIRDPQPPAVADSDWPRSPIDHFILARLEAAGLSPAADADRETLLRRVHFVLTGLPPTVEEQDAFLADASAGALDKVVDRLLASDAFAERWARHWLDISRYADTSGGGRAMPLPDAWRFRDYVIESFREDKPLDQLIREHIAGDLLAAESDEQRMEQLTGTGYLVLGPHNYENQDKDLLDLEIVDEQLDTIGRAFLGMTIGCARCHDHKFDPIPTADYYAMAGIFTSTRSVRHSNVSKWYTRAYFPSGEEAAALEAHERAYQPLVDRQLELKRELARLGQSPGGKPAAGTVASRDLPGIVVDDAAAEKVGDWMASTHTRPWVDEGYIHDETAGKGEKWVTFRPEIGTAGRYEVRVSWSASTNRSSKAPVTVVHADGEATVRVDQKKRPEHDGLFHTIGSYHFEKGLAAITIGNEGTEGGVVIADAVQLLPEGVDPATLTGRDEPGSESEPETSEDEGARVASLQAEYQQVTEQIKQLDKSKPKLPDVMAVDESDAPGDLEIRVRGMVRNLGEVAPRGFLQVASFHSEPVIGTDSGSGRLELAEWVTSADNPLTARVMANRIWQHLFGVGLVASPDNFGITGRLPTHPELLDHLATRLIANDWSVKRTIREILLSRTWQLSSEGEAAEIDMENELLSRAHRRKVDAETFRDSVLLLAGRLDSDAGGPALPAGFKSEFGYRFTSLKRSVYLPVFRNQPHEIFAAFDFANPNFVVGRRSSSTIPTQSLFLMNSPFIHEQAEAAAARLLEAPAATVEERVRLAWRQALCREPGADELRLSLEFIGGESDAAGWTALMRTLFSCVDFQYVR